MKRIIYTLPFIIIISIFVYLSFFININSIECSKNSTGCQYLDVEKMNSGLPTQIYKLKKELNVQLHDNYYIQSYNLRFNLPDKLIVDVTKRTPVFALGSGEPDSWYSIVAENGLVMSIEESTQLDILQSPKLANPGEFVSQESLKAYKIYKNVKPYFKVSSVNIKDDGLYIQTDDGFQAILPYDKDEEILVGAILVVFNRLNSSIEKSIMDNRDNQKLAEICSNGCLVDFRFQNPVIKAKI